jgi:hypothetical protein
MKWSKERDDLIAQTKAFVQSVTGRKPQVALEPASVGQVSAREVFVREVSIIPVSVSSAPIENPAVDTVSNAEPVSNPVANAVQIENLVPAEPIERVKQISDQPPAPVQSEVRKEIQTRVAAFQAHQHRFNRERDAYYNSVLAKARSDIKNNPDAPTS